MGMHLSTVIMLTAEASKEGPAARGNVANIFAPSVMMSYKGCGNLS